MSRGSSSQGQAVDNRTAQASLDEHNEMANSTATIQHQSDSGASHEEPDTPNSDHDNSDDTPSENDDSDCLSESSGDAVQRDFLDDLLLPVKHQLVERLMVYVANNPDLNIPLPSILPEVANHHQKNEIAPSLSSDLVHLGTSTKDQKVSLKYEVLEKNQDDSTKETSLVADSKETQHSPGKVGQRPTTSRGYGQNCYTTQAGSSNSRAGKKRKNGDDGSPEGNGDNGDDDEDERCRASKSRRSQSPHSPQRRIACPYFQRNPMRTAKADSCFRNGFSSIAKMKEHLERVHDNSIQCPRCYEIFKKQDQLDSHLRVGDAQLCTQAQTRPDLEGYSSAQANRLKERMRSRTVEEKWNTIWKILFPTDADRDIQSPWWDPTRRPDFYGRYEEFQREDLPTRITPQIMAFVDLLLADDHLRSKIDAIVRNALEESLDAFKTREAAGQFAPRDGEAGPSAAGEGPSNAGSSFTSGPAMVPLVQTQRGLDVWRPAPGDADVGFGETGAQPQGVQMPHRMVAAPVINEPEAVRTEANNDYQDVDGSFLNVDNGGSAMHTPFGHTPEGQWDGGSDGFTFLYGDLTFPSDTQASYGGNI
ncbi:hypothetical protein SLS56_005595 [Neofusicoccum ribis]|uniref:C2H2-type domain-containing protein n=1 Tax=Neofusicoccum ribis TaxID=45134 RepID=A0ABR3STD2_9PEZI